MAVDILALERASRESRACHDDPAFRRAYDKMYLAALDDFRNSKPEEHDKREAAYWRLRALDDLDAHLVLEIKAPQFQERQR